MESIGSFVSDIGSPMVLGCLISFIIYFPFTIYLLRQEYKKGFDRGKLEAENEQLKIRLEKSK